MRTPLRDRFGREIPFADERFIRQIVKEGFTTLQEALEAWSYAGNRAPLVERFRSRIQDESFLHSPRDAKPDEYGTWRYEMDDLRARANIRREPQGFQGWIAVYDWLGEDIVLWRGSWHESFDEALEDAEREKTRLSFGETREHLDHIDKIRRDARS